VTNFEHLSLGKRLMDFCFESLMQKIVPQSELRDLKRGGDHIYSENFKTRI
jgi:hypothetical protein